MAVVRKKQDDKYLKVLRELVTTGGGNRQCFDCGQKGPTYVNMTIGSFVCTRCSGVLRGLTPPHRVKSISMATFTQEEIDFLKAHGNDLCAKTWLGLWDPKRAVHQDHRELMIDKYERKRYYLEPASPLKSLTNAASLKTGGNSNNKNSTSSSSLPQQPLTNGYGGNHSTNTNINSNTNHSSAININGGSKQPGGIDSSFQNITLTPPTSQRTTQNGLHKSATSSSAISRPQNGYHHQQQQQQHDAFMTHNGFNGNGLHGLNVSIGSGSASTGALSDTSSCASNGFGPDADFVADFGSANIFDATSAGSVGSPAVSSTSSVASSNGYAKIQPIKAAQFMMNGNALAVSARNQHNVNGTNNNNNAHTNGHSNNNTENFADFDHAPIYNAAGLPMTNGFSKHAATSTNAFNNNNNKNNNNHNNTNNNKNNNKSSLPAEDRYAALKDLDEQLRESKAVAAATATVGATNAVDAFGNNNNASANVNPFKQQQQHQQQQQQQHAAVVNPFQTQQQQQQQQQNIFGQMATLVNGANGSLLTNGFQQQQHQQQQQPSYFSYSNGFSAAATTATMFPTSAPSSGPNGCGFGFGSMQQQIAATAGGAAFNNPFAATGGSLNSNNPFL